MVKVLIIGGSTSNDGDYENLFSTLIDPNNIFLKDNMARLKYQQIKLKLRFPISYFMKVFNQKVY
jgi:hypothetical protein